MNLAANAGLEKLAGLTLAAADARFVLDSELARGGMGVTFMAHAVDPTSGPPTVVIKLVLPVAWLKSRATVELAFKKELECLQRLSRQQPACPFVVRWLCHGALPLTLDGNELALPWLALEHVPAHEQGNTLEQRVRHAVSASGCAFAPERAFRAVTQLAAGLNAISEVAVVHRDISPSNVLVSGAPADEALKITDFGLSRAEGMPGTFGHKALGKPGYAAPEQLLRDFRQIGPASDVFALAAATFFMLSGEHLLPQRFVETIEWLQQGRRKHLLDSDALPAGLRSRPELCTRLDAVFAGATELEPAQRPQRASELAAALEPLLRE